MDETFEVWLDGELLFTCRTDDAARLVYESLRAGGLRAAFVVERRPDGLPLLHRGAER